MSLSSDEDIQNNGITESEFLDIIANQYEQLEFRITSLEMTNLQSPPETSLEKYINNMSETMLLCEVEFWGCIQKGMKNGFNVDLCKIFEKCYNIMAPIVAEFSHLSEFSDVENIPMRISMKSIDDIFAAFMPIITRSIKIMAHIDGISVNALIDKFVPNDEIVRIIIDINKYGTEYTLLKRARERIARYRTERDENIIQFPRN